MTTTALLVEDDNSVRETATLVLEGAGFEVESVADGAAAIERAIGGSFDLVIIDVMLPTISGFDVCREIRKRSRVPIVMLTALSDTAEVVKGLELGADDYMTKPFQPAELVARARAAVRRTPVHSSQRWRAGDIEVDEAAFQAFRGGQQLLLTATEFRLLVALARRPGEVLTREELLSAVWGYDYLGDSRLVDMAVRRLRSKLGDSPAATPYITTVRSVGYRFERLA